jgi:hypothetical protein
LAVSLKTALPKILEEAWAISITLHESTSQDKKWIAQKLREARILSQGTDYLLEIIYEQPETPLKPAQNNITSKNLGLSTSRTVCPDMP